MSVNDELQRCRRCASLLHTGEGRTLLGLTADELDELAAATSSEVTRARLLCALELLDAERATALRALLDR